MLGAVRHLDGDDNIAIGTRENDATAAAPRTVANTVTLGSDTKATVNGAVALGNKSVASTAAGVEGADPLNAVAAKNNATWTSTAAAVSVGDVANNITRQITGVAAGKEDTDVVNVAQLKAMSSAAKTHYYSVNSTEAGAGSNRDNDGATGTDALAAGVKAQAAQRNSIAIGNEAKVENSPANPSSSSIAIGDKAKAQGDLALAIGPGATVSGESAAGGIAIGSAATSNNGGMAVGSGANAGNGTPIIFEHILNIKLKLI